MLMGRPDYSLPSGFAAGIAKTSPSMGARRKPSAGGLGTHRKHSNLRLDLTKAAVVQRGVARTKDARRGPGRVASWLDAPCAAPIVFAETSWAAFAAQPCVERAGGTQRHDKRSEYDPLRRGPRT